MKYFQWTNITSPVNITVETQVWFVEMKVVDCISRSHCYMKPHTHTNALHFVCSFYSKHYDTGPKSHIGVHMIAYASHNFPARQTIQWPSSATSRHLLSLSFIYWGFTFNLSAVCNWMRVWARRKIKEGRKEWSSHFLKKFSSKKCSHGGEDDRNNYSVLNLKTCYQPKDKNCKTELTCCSYF